MGNVKIIADSTCDLSQDLLQKYDISIIPLMITMGADSYKDGIEIKVNDIYEWSDRSGETPKTAAPSIGDAVEAIKPFVQADRDIIFFGISEAMSATCNVLRLAAQELDYDKLYVINSKNLSTGIGLQVVRAAKLSQSGRTSNEIIADNERIVGSVRASFVVDTLTYLHRGGRCSAVAALLANTLRLKPEIVVIDGKMDVDKKYRGKQKSVIMKYVKDRQEELLKSDPARIFITHSGCSADIVKEVQDYLKDLNYFDEVLETHAGGVISSHCGPNTLGILYILK